MSTDPRVAAKQATGRRAAEFVESGMKVGLGTGSTVHHTILSLGQRARAGLDIVCTATSDRTEQLGSEVGLRVVSPDEISTLDIAIDGADEVDPALNLTKGGGGAHTREKVVATLADRFIVVVDESKLVEQLGPFGTPLEVLEFAPETTSRWVRRLGASSVEARPERSDSGNLLMDAQFGRISDPVGLATALSCVPGIVEHGIFLGDLVERVVIAGEDGSVRELTH